MAWAVDKAGVVLLLVCQLLTGIAAAIVLTFTAQAMTHVLGTGSVSERLHAAVPALTVVTTAAGALAESVAPCPRTPTGGSHLW